MPEQDREHLSAGRLTPGEAALLGAWRHFRREHPDLQPTASELARVMQCSVGTAWNRMCAVARKGYIVRTRDMQHAAANTPRAYRLTSEAAAAPHLASLVKIATALAGMNPADVQGDSRDALLAARARADVILRDIIAQCKVLSKNNAPTSRQVLPSRAERRARRDANRGRSSAPTPPNPPQPTPPDEHHAHTQLQRPPQQQHQPPA